MKHHFCFFLSGILIELIAGFLWYLLYLCHHLDQGQPRAAWRWRQSYPQRWACSIATVPWTFPASSLLAVYCIIMLNGIPSRPATYAWRRIIIGYMGLRCHNKNEIDWKFQNSYLHSTVEYPAHPTQSSILQPNWEHWKQKYLSTSLLWTGSH